MKFKYVLLPMAITDQPDEKAYNFLQPNDL